MAQSKTFLINFFFQYVYRKQLFSFFNKKKKKQIIHKMHYTKSKHLLEMVAMNDIYAYQDILTFDIIQINIFPACSKNFAANC